MMNRFEVTVIIPTYNEEKFIGTCIESVLKQSYPIDLLDILVIDGGSSDKTLDIVNRYMQKYSNIRLLNNPGKIQSIAFNIGVKESSAPFIVRLDAHTFYKQRYIELCIKHLSEHPEYGNVGGVLDIRPQKHTIQAEANAILNKVSFGIGGAAFRIGAEAGCVDTVPFGAFPRDLIMKIGGMRDDLARGEDNEFNSRIRKAGYKIFLDPQIESVYFARDTIWASIKQMYANGKSIGKLFYIDCNAIGLRHLVPMSFVLSLIFSLLISAKFSPFIYLFFGILCLYFFVDFLATLSTCMKFGFRYLGVLPFLFFSVHVSYGLGTLVGMLKRK